MTGVPDEFRTGEVHGATLEAELLDRLERQVAELTELRQRVKTLEAAVESERNTRSDLSKRLAAERERAKGLEDDLEAFKTDEEAAAKLLEELRNERQNAFALGAQLEQAWSQLDDSRAQGPKGRFRRRR